MKELPCHILNYSPGIYRHDPPSMDSTPRRSSLKGISSSKYPVDLECESDDIRVSDEVRAHLRGPPVGHLVATHTIARSERRGGRFHSRVNSLIRFIR